MPRDIVLRQLPPLHQNYAGNLEHFTKDILEFLLDYKACSRWFSGCQALMRDYAVSDWMIIP